MTSILPSHLVWQFFSEIAAIPRPSGKEEKIRNFLIDFAREHNLLCHVDEVGNVLISKPASKGYENRNGFVLQTHIDMVCEKNADVRHDFETDPIKLLVKDGWLHADGTTLGADNGVGMAMALAALTDKQLAHPALECLFTVDEETGLYGAAGLATDLLTQPTLLNLDTEEEGEFCIGCAGGTDTIAEIAVAEEDTPDGLFFFHLKVSGLQGGHSGMDIDKKRGNAIKILADCLADLQTKTTLRLAHISGGNLRNAIPREAETIAAVPFADKEMLRVEINHLIHKMEEMFPNESGLRIELSSCDHQKSVFALDLSKNLIATLHRCPHGVVAMSREIPSLVETSTNLAAIRLVDGKIIVETSQRSAVETQKNAIAHEVGQVFSNIGATLWRGKDYPGWTPNVHSPILQKSKEVYLRLFGKEPKVTVVHAGLECGILSQKYPQMDMISFGPDIENPHSPSERVNIASVEKSWNFLVELLK